MQPSQPSLVAGDQLECAARVRETLCQYPGGASLGCSRALGMLPRTYPSLLVLPPPVLVVIARHASAGAIAVGAHNSEPPAGIPAMASEAKQ